MPKLTKDESFLLTVYEKAKEHGDLGLEINYQHIGQKLVLTEKTTKNIVRDLAQANFIKKTGQDSLILTQNGINLAQKVQEGWIF